MVAPVPGEERHPSAGDLPEDQRIARWSPRCLDGHLTGAGTAAERVAADRGEEVVEAAAADDADLRRRAGVWEGCRAHAPEP